MARPPRPVLRDTIIKLNWKMEKPILKIDGLVKTFRSHWTFRPIEAVRDVSLEVRHGESFGFLGHNGAGKTTTIKCIVGLIHTTRGKIFLEGEELRRDQQRSLIGYLPEQPYFYDHLSVYETLELFASLHGMRGKARSARVEQTLEMVHLADRKKSSVGALSKGLQQRLGLAQAILNEPKLLLLDEPFSGLDPIGRVEVRELILGLQRKGTTIFMSSHILSDVEDICTRVAILAKGEMKSTFELSDVPKLFGEAYELGFCGIDTESELCKRLLAEAISRRCKDTAAGDAHVLRFSDYDLAHRAMLDVSAAGAQITEFQNVGLSLEDIFVNITEAADSLNSLSKKTASAGEEAGAEVQ